MEGKISQDRAIQLSAQFYLKYMPTPQSASLSLIKQEDQMAYAKVLAESFANFHKAFCNRLEELL